MTMIASLLAVLVPASATLDTIDAHLAAPLHFLPVDRYRLGGEFTGLWDPDYDPRRDPANWRRCPHCAGTGQACPGCADAEPAGRDPGTVLAASSQWVPHSGDLIPLPRLLNPQFRFPAGDQLATERETTAPDLYADRFFGFRALDKAASGAVSTGLRTVLQAILSGHMDNALVAAADWQIAVVAAHITDRQKRAALPGLGSLVQIIDPQHRHGEAPDQLYVVRDDFNAPDHYDLVSLGDLGPNVPGYALTEIDPARVRLLPAPDGALPYPPGITDADS
ncbi:hypothetical protein [Actinoplanes sp. M2I2]|uniref:hypothetical protein n=1 Tax=Actinoplanes sp. M2I2 TaxID=1734444 RepID=UPI00202186F9|nr:hypothetical protein [Actinoplanes sp. M2I2]